MKRFVPLLAAAVLAAAPALAESVAVETARGTVAVPSNPEKIVVFDVGALDTLDALGIRPAGTVEKVFVDYLDEATENAEAVGTLFEPDFEAVNALAPDLIVVGSRSAEQLEPLSKFAPTIDMTIWGNDVVGQARARLAAYGEIFGRQDEAKRLAGELDAGLERAKAAAAGKGTALIVLTNGPKISAYGKGSRFGWLHDELDLPQAVESVEEATHGEAISFEFIRNANPDWLLVIDRSAAIGAEGERAAETLDNALVAETTAWKKGQVIYLNAADLYVAAGGFRSLMNTFGLIEKGFRPSS
ncbi:siderophore ABC transporter substrate-binding protein [Oricola thermophila]|uniref:Siderophore ABC transporter substrate-binding protein n=1 Tax=Oricola thermophila TaxID=2742145 RepID=A0A6N1V8E9_9HYPH|nr:siderophore ABC transporter substrate-binding protein [Oricola thermophila]QKV17236.1 siderophore ABC transporter substrate-binding protein [Oricola thermophila]